MKDRRDLRDPEILGHLYRAARGRGLSIDDACAQRAPDYEDQISPVDRYPREKEEA
jgi:hypothetical protein